MARPNGDPGFTNNDYEIKTLLQKPVFQKGVLIIRKKWDIPPNGFLDNVRFNAWRAEIPYSNFVSYKESIRKLADKLGLAERWHEGISHYIYFNQPGMLRTPTEGPLNVTYEGNALDHSKVRAVSIEIDADTTQRELVSQFHYAQEILGFTKKKKQRPINLDRDLLIMNLHESGMKSAAIASQLNSNHETSFNDDDIRTIIKRMKRRLK